MAVYYNLKGTTQSNFQLGKGGITLDAISNASLGIQGTSLVLNNNVTGTPSANADFAVERGTSANVSIRWNETNDRWEYTNDGSTYTAIGAAVSFDSLTDVDLTGAANNDLLYRSGGNWIDTAGGLTWDGSSTLKVRSTGDAALILEADSDNVTETDNAYITFYQDNQTIEAEIGLSSTAGQRPNNGATLAGTTYYADNDLIILTDQSIVLSPGTGTTAGSVPALRVSESRLVAGVALEVRDAVNNTLGTTTEYIRLDINSTSDATVLVKSSGDSVLILEADTDDSVESHNAYIVMSQDGGQGSAVIGLAAAAGTNPYSGTVSNGGANDLVIAKAGGSGFGGITIAASNIGMMQFDDQGSRITNYVPHTTVASSTTAAGFNVPHGTAPTSPVNGDIWTTTAGVFARVNGNTRTILNAEADQTISGQITFSNTGDTYDTIFNGYPQFQAGFEARDYIEFRSETGGTDYISMYWINADGAADEKTWVIESDASLKTFAFRNCTDALGSYKDFLKFTRSGNAVTNIDYGNSTDFPLHTFYSKPSANNAFVFDSAAKQKIYFFGDASSAGGGPISDQITGPASGYAWWEMTAWGKSTTASSTEASLWLGHLRGSEASPAASQTSDELGDVLWWGRSTNGTQSVVGRIIGIVETVNTGTLAGGIDIRTHSGTGGAVTGQTSRMYLKSTGEIALGTDGWITFDEHTSAPGTPASGRVAVYAKADGKIYRKDDTGTETELGGGGGASVTISDTAPGSPTAGDLWWESDTGILKVYYNDGTSSQWVDASPVPAPNAGITVEAKSTSFNAAVNYRYMITGNSVTATLPSSATLGDTIYFVAGTSTITGFTVGRNGLNIMGLAENMTVDDNTNFAFGLVYNDSTNGWRVI